MVVLCLTGMNIIPCTVLSISLLAKKIFQYFDLSAPIRGLAGPMGFMASPMQVLCKSGH